MSNAIINKLRKLVDQKGAAQVSVWLGYRDSRAIGVWLATGKIPKIRHERVKLVLKQKGARRGKRDHKRAS